MVECGFQASSSGLRAVVGEEPLAHGHGSVVGGRGPVGGPLRRRIQVWSGAIVLLIAVGSRAQVASLDHDPPRWGQTITVTYDPAIEGATIPAWKDPLMVLHVLSPEDKEQRVLPVRKEGGRFRSSFIVPTGTSRLAIYFTTPEGWDRSATLMVSVQRPDGTPAMGAKGADLLSVGEDAYEARFAEEMALYPDNHAAYRQKWFAAQVFDKENLESIIKADMETLRARVKGEPIGYLYSMAAGYMFMGDEPAGRAMIEKMLDRHPDAYLTESALGTYEYQVFAHQIKGEGPDEVKALVRRLLDRYPSSRIARKQVRLLSKEKDLPLSVTEGVTRAWIKDQPDHPTPYIAFARACHAHGTRLDEAAMSVSKGLSRLLAGNLQRYGDISGMRTGYTLPSAYYLSAQIAVKRHDTAGAIASLEAARALEVQDTARTYDLEGAVWRDLGWFSRAEENFVKAIDKGSQDAEGSLRAMYEKRRGTAEGFDVYLAGLQSAAPSDAEEKPVAPAFKLTDLGGTEFELAKLRGKVVVMNFWFIGCAPCLVEIPGLNKLVEEFGEKDVVFIAPASDNREALDEFLKEKPFKYRVIAEAFAVASAYGVQGFPTHVIIDREGRIRARLTGGSEDADETLRPHIKAALRAGG